MSDKKVWTREETVQLIEKFEQYRELWDTKCKDYRNKIKKNSTLQMLAVEFNTTDIEISRKLHNLKTQFGQELKKERQRKSGQCSNEVYKSKWEYFYMMKFTLDQHIPAATDDSMDSYTDRRDLIEESRHDTLSASFKRSKKSITNDDLEKATKILNKSDDEFQIFGDYIASVIRNMHYVKYQGELKRKIQYLIIEMTEMDDNEYLAREGEVSSNEVTHMMYSKHRPHCVLDENESTMYQPTPGSSHVVSGSPEPGPSHVVDKNETCKSIVVDINGVKYLIDSLPLGTLLEDIRIERGNTQSQ